jgi:hypothetical protein
MLDGVEPEIIDKIAHAAGHVEGVEKVAEAKARWLGHKLHVDVAVVIDESVLLAEANLITSELEKELFAHIPALAVATVRFTTSEPHGHHHAPDPFRFSGQLAQGVLEIADTDDGERFRLRVSRHAEGLAASVEIQREGGMVEEHALVPVDGNHHVLQSLAAPAEPHEFEGQLLLAGSADSERLFFKMLEPGDHHH